MRLRRRDLLGLAAGALAWPYRTSAQAPLRKVGLLMAIASDDAEAAARSMAFATGLAAEGWTAGGNVELIYRWAGADRDRTRVLARELVDLKTDVLVGHASPATLELLALTKATPIVFALVADPVGSGLVSTLGSSSGNVTGFLNFDASLVGKWIELLREIDPKLNRALMLFNPETAPDAGGFFMRPLTEAGNRVGVQAVSGPVKSDAEIESVIASFAATPGGAIVAPPDVFVATHREAIIGSAALHRVPAVYPYRYFASEGGLVSYGIDTTDVFRQVGGYAGQLLRGTKVADLPIRAPSKFEFVANLKTAKTLGVTIPQTMLARADDVIDR